MGDFTDDMWADIDDICNGDITCHHCGDTGLRFSKVGGKWRLWDENDNLHICDKIKVAKRDFTLAP